jgi:hypothetical protein
MTTPKEPHYFSRPDFHARGIKWYESLFEGAGDATAIGEGSASYASCLFGQIASERIFEALPNARLIYCVRHPLRRIESAWVHVRCRPKFTPADIACGIRPVPADFEVGILRSEFAKELIGTSLYWRQINLFRRFFPDTRIHIVFFEDFVRDPRESVRDCLRFLGADDTLMPSGSPTHLNESEKKKVPTRIYQAMSTVPVLRRLTLRLPERLRLRNVKKPVWTKRAYDYVLNLVRDDTIAFLEHCARPSSFWDLGDAC